MPFDSAHPSLLSALTARGYAEPTPVQAAILAPDAASRDLLVSAQTGSGKTVAFGLALAPILLGEAATLGPAGAPLALVIAPTRELAIQVHRELSWLYDGARAVITTCVGGMDPRRERYALSRGVHIVVGTPGRLRDHLERTDLDLSKLGAVVLDEADEMLDMGFREDLERLLGAAPPERRTLMFSATIPKDIATLAKRFQQQALRVTTAAEGDPHRDIAYQAVPVIPRERDLAVVNLLRYHDAPGALVFCSTRDRVTHLSANLAERGFSVASLSGELSQRERNHALQALRDGRARVCVATDVAARGLDLPDLGLVIHADLPQNKQTMVHRSGRTGRAGRKGVAILVVPEPARRFVERMLSGASIELTWTVAPSADEIRRRDQHQLMLEVRALAELPTPEDLEVAKSLLAERAPEELVAALVRARRAVKPAPEEMTLPPSLRPRSAQTRDPRDRPPGREYQGRPDTRGPRDNGPRDNGPRGQGPRDFQGARDFQGPRGATGPRGSFGARGPRADHAPPGDRGPRDHAAPGDRGPRPDGGPNDRPRSAPRDGAPGVWFSVNVGRSKNADPKWLIPLLCRRGEITKQAIGKIQVLVRETRVEISADASAKFAEAVRRPDPKDRNITIEPVDS